MCIIKILTIIEIAVQICTLGVWYFILLTSLAINCKICIAYLHGPRSTALILADHISAVEEIAFLPIKLCI